jgi:hypothetical protein
MRADVPIPMPDGVTLRADLYHPVTTEPQPALVAWSPYKRDLMTTGAPAPCNEVGSVRYLAACGYPVLVVNARGTGGSEGEFRPIGTEGEDICAAIEWAAVQPWCDGNIAMTGMSYFGMSQLLVAGLRPPHLKAIFPFGSLTDLYRHLAYHGGALTADFLADYFAINGSLQELRIPPFLRHLMSYVLANPLLPRAYSRLMPKLGPVLPRRLHPPRSWLKQYARLAVDEPFDGPDYHRSSAWPTLDKIEVPVLLGCDWGMVGTHLFGAFEAWHRITAPKRLLVAPAYLGWPYTRFQTEAVAYFDHVVRGVDNGYDALPPVRYWLHGAERWEHATDWPPPDASALRFRLRPERPEGAGDDVHGSLSPVPLGSPSPSPSPSPAPAERDEARSWLAFPRGMLYPREIERYEACVLGYLSDPVPDDHHLVGPVDLTLRMIATAPDTYVQVRLSAVSPSPGGRSRVLSVGGLLASHRRVDPDRSNPTEIVHDHTRAEPLPPGEPVTLRFSLAPFAYLLPAGHRLLLEIGSDSERLAPPIKEGFLGSPVAAPPYPSRNTVIHGDSELSELRLTVRGR